uniref:Receptor expression-enhancing protein n=1 Tax=Noctiluca scintillans TaxID=2966 RepID=A0A7S0ZMU0_NOCSC
MAQAIFAPSFVPLRISAHLVDAMLPYFLILPLWLLVAIVWPVLQTLHALSQSGSKYADMKKMWLCYWFLFVTASVFLFYFEWLVYIPFAVLSYFVDVYYEAQLLLVLWLVFPGSLGIKQVQRLISQNADTALPELQDRVTKSFRKLYHESG